MASVDNGGIVKQLRAVIEEDQLMIRKLQQEIDRLRYLVGLHSLNNSKSKAARRDLQSETSQPPPDPSN